MSPSLRVGRVGALQAFAAVVIAVAMLPHVAATPPLVAKMPHFTIDMDDSPSERWSTAVGSLVAMHGWEHTYGGFFATIAKAIAPMPDSVFSMMEYSLSKHPEMFEELMGVQAAFMSLGHNVSKNILMTGSFVYAFQHLEPSTSEVTNLRGASDAWEATMAGNMPQARGACSSIIAQNEDGTIIHGRNNDAGQTFRNITAQITWIKGSTVVLKTVQYVGFIGSWTSVRPGIASLSQDTRMYQGYSMSYILENIVQSAPTDWILRDAIMHAANFSALVSTLSEVHLPAPSYFIVGGVQPGEGVIITRNFSTCAPLLRLADKAGIPPQPHSKVAAWAIVETNWDYWKKDPAADPRRIQELAHLAEYGQSYGATLMGLHQVLTTPGQPRGALNTATLYNAMMCAANATLIPRLECYDGCAG